ncbi:MAG: glycosyltransferase family 39 protein, partial [Nanoarchaeota archaeon]
ASIGSIILIFYFGRLLFNGKIGLMSAFLMSFFPLDVVYATQLGSDIPSSFFMALGVYVFLYAEMRRKMKYGLNYILSGILIGIGYMIRESALLIALFFVAYIAYKRKIKKEYFLVPLGVLMIFALESFVFFVLTGDPIYRVVSSQQYNAKAVIEHNYFGRLDFPTGLLHYPWLFLTNNLLIYFYAFVLIALVYILIKRRKEAYIMLIWLIPLLLYLSFGSASLAQYIPFRAVDRYTSVFTVPAIILLAFFLSEKRAMIKKWVMPITLAFLLLASIGAVYVRENRHLLDNLRDVSPFLKGLDKAVFIDDRSLAAINYLSGYAINKNLNEYPDSLDKVKDSYIAINRHMIRSLKEANPKVKFPEEIENIPKEWIAIKEFGSSENDKIVIYQIP